MTVCQFKQKDNMDKQSGQFGYFIYLLHPLHLSPQQISARKCKMFGGGFIYTKGAPLLINPR